MNKFLQIVVIVFAFAKAYSSNAQNYNQHTVSKGETLTAIAAKYGTSIENIMELNPDVRNGLKVGQSLILPADAGILTQAKIKGFKKHKAEKGETLYSIAKQYGVTVLDIKEANKELYTNELRKGDKLKIPEFELAAVSNKTNNVKDTPFIAKTNLKEHVVAAGEGKYGIGKKYGLTVDELDRLNPTIKDLQVGMVLIVDKALLKKEITKKADSNYGDYTIPEKLGMYSLEKLTGMTEKALVALNPILKDGLKANMVIKLPKAALASINSYKTAEPAAEPAKEVVISKKNLNSKFKGQRIAVMLPLSLQRVDTATTDLKRLKQDGTMRIAVDFYSGMLVAQDSAKRMGIPVKFDIFDTEKDEKQTIAVLDANDFSDYNCVIGPLLGRNVELTAERLVVKKIPVISPLTTVKMSRFTNLFQARPNESLMKVKLMSYLKKYAVGKNVIIVSDNKAGSLRNEFKNAFPNAKVLVPSQSNFIYKKDYLEALSLTEENVVILAGITAGIVDDAVSVYGAKTKEYSIRAFAYENFDDMFLPKADLGALQFTFPSMNMYKGYGKFYTDYKNRFGNSPTDHATRGFDVAMDIILRQKTSGTLYESVKSDGASMMTENGFNYIIIPNEGYVNDKFFLLQYTSGGSLRQL